MKFLKGGLTMISMKGETFVQIKLQAGNCCCDAWKHLSCIEQQFCPRVRLRKEVGAGDQSASTPIAAVLCHAYKRLVRI
jgi:hypothetical protein